MDYVVRIYLTFVENCQTGFQSGCTVLHSHLLLHILTNVWWCQVLGFGHSRRSTMVFHCSVCISLMTHDDADLFLGTASSMSSAYFCGTNSEAIISIKLCY